MEHLNKELLEEANKKIFSGKNSNTKNVVFIYTPMKVGSTTLVSSIRISANNYFIVLHIHNEDGLRILTGIQNITINDLILYNSMIGKNVYVIDVYRSPIERKISSFFELIEMHFNNSQENINEYSLERITNRFNDIFLHVAKEDYFMDKYQITIPENFDFFKKFLFIREKNVNYIKLRLKDSLEWGKILSILLEKEIVIINDYETNGKQIKNLYEKFKNNYRIPSNLLEEIKNCKYLNYYYSASEKELYINEWSRKMCVPVISYNSLEYDLYLKITVENSTRNLIQSNHYMDVGCICGVCSRKRQEILDRVKKGESVKEKIQHNELVNQVIKNTNNKINERINSLKKVEKLNNKNMIKNWSIVK